MRNPLFLLAALSFSVFPEEIPQNIFECHIDINESMIYENMGGRFGYSFPKNELYPSSSILYLEGPKDSFINSDGVILHGNFNLYHASIDIYKLSREIFPQNSNSFYVSISSKNIDSGIVDVYLVDRIMLSTSSLMLYKEDTLLLRLNCNDK